MAEAEVLAALRRDYFKQSDALLLLITKYDMRECFGIAARYVRTATWNIWVEDLC